MAFSAGKRTGAAIRAIKTTGFDHPVWFEPVSTKTGGPDFILTSRQNTEIGAGWKRTGKHGEYISVKLDSPFLPEPVNCALIAQPSRLLALIWHREKSKEKAAA